MAEWQYRIHRVNVQAHDSLDQELESILGTFGKDGWELVQVLHPHGPSGEPVYRIIFKAEKPLD